MTFFSPIDVSIVVPFYNESGNIERLVRQIQACFKNIRYELILVDDGSTDGSAEVLQSFDNSNIRLLILNGNYGQSTAIKAGLDICKGDKIALLDGDMQNDPADLLEMLAIMDSNNLDIIQGYRQNRHDSIGKRLPSYCANRLIKLLFGFPCNDIGCAVKVFRKDVLDRLIYFNGFHRYISLIAFLKGFTVSEKKVNHASRNIGKSKYGMGRIFPVVYHLFMLRVSPGQLTMPLAYSVAEMEKEEELVLEMNAVPV